MKVAIVGATGNVGTAVLRALAQEEQVSDVVGIARRLPTVLRPPYDTVRWHRIDIADHSDPTDALTAAFDGADTVIHLAWAIQPNDDRDLLRRTNVLGTQRVADAAVRANVGHLVVASSLAVYSPVTDKDPRDETSTRGGIRSSHYSVDKVAQERILDQLEASSDVLVTRMRPALIFQGDAGAQIVRYFVGPFLPRALMQPGILPAMPLPRGLHLQAVHSDDVARAYATVVRQRATGAFNVAAADTLYPADLARLVDHGRPFDLPPRLFRPGWHAAWRLRLLAADPGWLDMALGAPVLDTSRIRSLGWQEQHSAGDALLELLDGMREARGRSTPALRPNDTRFGGAIDRPSAVHRRRPLPASVTAASVPAHVEADLLGLYLSDHLTGATAGVHRIHRMADSFADTTIGPDLARIAAQISEERIVLVELIDRLGLRRRRYRQAAAWVAERAGRLKLNRRILTESPMTPLLETELMRAAVLGKKGVWQVLLTHADDLGLPESMLQELITDADGQAQVLDNVHAQVRQEAFRHG